jgi:hypothetical protein
MKSILTATIISALALSAVVAQDVGPTIARPNPNAPNEPPAVATTPNDGYWLRHNVPVLTLNGITTELRNDQLLPNGLRVQHDGTVTLRSGQTSTLQQNLLLTLDGQFVALPAAMQAAAGTTPTHPDVSRAQAKEVGLSGKDGITVSGTDMLITRNGVTDKITAEVKLPNGAIAKPDGTVILANGQKILLRPDQLLDLNGKLHEAPVQPNPPGIAPSYSTPNQ